jgi:splicing factor U2AF subunit
VVSSVVVDTQNKLCIANMPPYLSEEQVTELLVSFGELKAFVLVRDRHTEESRVSMRLTCPSNEKLC